MNIISRINKLLCSHHIYQYKIIQFYDKGGKLVIEYNVIDSWNKKGYRPAYYSKNRYRKCISCGKVQKNIVTARLSNDEWYNCSKEEYDSYDPKVIIDLAIIDRDKKIRDLLGDK
jgi:hypothetical protein